MITQLIFNLFVCNSGDGPEIPLVKFGEAPKTRRERLAVLQTMVAHSQFCISGDHTVEAIEAAVRKINNSNDEQGIIFVVSDANLNRYGIHPRELTTAMGGSNDVFYIALASFGLEAEQIIESLPIGRGFTSLHSKNLPSIFAAIFQSSVVDQ